MAAVIEMGEVDEMHSKEDGNVITNGDLSNDIDMENPESQDSIKQQRTSLTESMEVDDIEEKSNEAKETTRHDEQISTTEDSTEDTNENTTEDNDTNTIEEKDTNTAEENENGATTAEEENDTTAEESSAETDNRSELNEDESSQETKASEQPDQPNNCDEEQSNEMMVDGSEDDEKSKSGKDDDNSGEAEESDVITTETKDKDNIEEDNNHDEDRPNDSFSQIVIEKVHTVDDDEEDEIHEIVSDEDEETGNKQNNKHATTTSNSNNETIELNDDTSGDEDDDEEDDDGDVTFVETTTKPKENGTNNDEVIELQETPEKKSTKPATIEVITPRRSSRNLNKSKSYVELEKDASPSPPPLSSRRHQQQQQQSEEEEESDVEEVLPQDPLACSNNDAITVERIIPMDKSKLMSLKHSTSTIVVKDTKRLVEIATKSNNSSSTSSSTLSISGRKEPTLVIIDTNSILSGRGAVPVKSNSNNTQQSHKQQQQASYSTILPMALPAQGMYPPNMRATITPIPLNSANISSSSVTLPPKTSPATITPTNLSSAPLLLPTLTDDMYVVEAPSFIVPYVYEKPPVKDFKSFVKELQEAEKKKEKEAKEKEKEAKDKMDEDSKESVVEDKKIDAAESKSEDVAAATSVKKDNVIDDLKKSYSYFDSPLGKFFINIGFNLVQEYVQTDLLKQQKRKANREGGSNPETEKTIKSLAKNLEFSKENNEPFKAPIKKCEFCNFKTESQHVMSYHLETPHMKNFVYKCNFCAYEVRSPHDILFHMEAEHAVRGHLERAPAFHQCPSCPFEDNQKGKMSRHLVACMKKFKPDRNLEPPIDWEPPAKIPRVPKMRQQGLNATAAAYHALAGKANSSNTTSSQLQQYQFLSKMQQLQHNNAQQQQVMQRGRGRPQLGSGGGGVGGAVIGGGKQSPQTLLRPSGMVFKQQPGGGSVLVPTNYQLSGNQVFQNASSQGKKTAQQPSISITPLPRGTTTNTTAAKPGDTTSKNSFVICEICDGYIKDLEQLRNHMQWIHKIKIHPKMIYNRPPLNCQKCQFRFFTDQGLERHLLGSHGLVTSSMQDAANKSKDSGRCPVCGRVYQWKLLNHVARDHNMTLKPAHLSYKCTVCTATFGMYKQFENHVYSAHSVVAKRVMDKKAGSSNTGNNSSSINNSSSTSSIKSSTTSASSSSSDQLKPLKINDEITIIPQPATKSSLSTTNGSTSKDGSSTSSGTSNPKNNSSTTPSTSKRKAAH